MQSCREKSMGKKNENFRSTTCGEEDALSLGKTAPRFPSVKKTESSLEQAEVSWTPCPATIAIAIITAFCLG